MEFLLDQGRRANLFSRAVILMNKLGSEIVFEVHPSEHTLTLITTQAPAGSSILKVVFRENLFSEVTVSESRPAMRAVMDQYRAAVGVAPNNYNYINGAGAAAVAVAASGTGNQRVLRCTAESKLLVKVFLSTRRQMRQDSDLSIRFEPDRVQFEWQSELGVGILRSIALMQPLEVVAPAFPSGLGVGESNGLEPPEAASAAAAPLQNVSGVVLMGGSENVNGNAQNLFAANDSTYNHAAGDSPQNANTAAGAVGGGAPGNGAAQAPGGNNSLNVNEPNNYDPFAGDAGNDGNDDDLLGGARGGGYLCKRAIPLQQSDFHDASFLDLEQAAFKVGEHDLVLNPKTLQEFAKFLTLEFGKDGSGTGGVTPRGTPRDLLELRFTDPGQDVEMVTRGYDDMFKMSLLTTTEDFPGMAMGHWTANRAALKARYEAERQQDEAAAWQQMQARGNQQGGHQPALLEGLQHLDHHWALRLRLLVVLRNSSPGRSNHRRSRWDKQDSGSHSRALEEPHRSETCTKYQRKPSGRNIPPGAGGDGAEQEDELRDYYLDGHQDVDAAYRELMPWGDDSQGSGSAEKSASADENDFFANMDDMEW
eukprot:g174.t1